MKTHKWIAVMAAIMLFMLITGTLVAQEAKQEEAEAGPPKININLATAQELQTLPGVGAKLVEAIIAGRPYAELDTLLKVEGMEEKIFEGFRESITADKLDLNKAPLEDFLKLPNMTQELAESIINGRPYMQVTELETIEGMSLDVVELLKGYVEGELERKERIERGRMSRSTKDSSVPQDIPPVAPVNP